MNELIKGLTTAELAAAVGVKENTPRVALVNKGHYWAASGLEDTLLRCQIQPEYLNGHYQKEVQQGI